MIFKINKSKTREELIERLKEIAADQTEYEIHFGAMCYSQIFVPVGKLICNECGKSISDRIDLDSYEKIHDIVKKIRKMGYDVMVEDLCVDCMFEKAMSGEYNCSIRSFEYVEHMISTLDADMRKDLSDAEISQIIRERCNSTEKYNFSEHTFICFYFKAKGFEKYHMTQNNYSYCYSVILNFLKDRRTLDDDFGKTHFLRDEFDTIESMTGIKPNND